MAFVDIPTLNGGYVHVSAGSVFRVTRALQGDNAAALTRVEFGAEIQLTNRSMADLAALLGDAGAKLVQLTAPDGSAVLLSVGAITAVRGADAQMDPPGANAVVTVQGHRQSVRESQQQVQAALAAAG